MSALTVLAPGKVNLTLLVGPPRPDGYHDLFTVFAPLALVDSLDVSLTPAAGPSSGLTVTCEGVDQDENLVTRALRAVERETGWSFSGEVAIHKRLPVAGGVGGGSSDAASALLAATRLLADVGGPTLTMEALRRLALSLGADVPFFLDPRPCLARGVGEELAPLPLPPLPLVLVVCAEPLSTAAVYRAFDRLGPGETAPRFAERSGVAEEAWRRLSADWAGGSVDAGKAIRRVAALLQNDLEGSACRLLDRLGPTLRRLRQAGALACQVSGSGPTTFGIWPTEAEAAEAASGLRSAGLDARATVAAGASS